MKTACKQQNFPMMHADNLKLSIQCFVKISSKGSQFSVNRFFIYYQQYTSPSHNHSFPAPQMSPLFYVFFLLWSKHSIGSVSMGLVFVNLNFFRINIQ